MAQAAVPIVVSTMAWTSCCLETAASNCEKASSLNKKENCAKYGEMKNHENNVPLPCVTLKLMQLITSSFIKASPNRSEDNAGNEDKSSN